MGRSLPTFRQYLEQFKQDWKLFRAALNRFEQESFDEVMVMARRHASASANTGPLDPFEGIVMSVFVEMAHRIRVLELKAGIE